MAGWESELDRRLPAHRRRQIGTILRGARGGVPGSKRALALLRECLVQRDGRIRRRLMESPLLGGWVQDLLFWMEVRALAERMLRGNRSQAAQTRLFDRIALTEFLTEMVPAGRLDRRFPGRVLRRADRSLRERMDDLPRILVPYLPARGKREVLPIFFREIPDEGSPARRVRLGESALTLAWRRGSPPASVRVRRVGRTLFLPSAVEVVIHETIPGTSILLAPRLLSRVASMRVGGPVPGLGERLARALSAVDAAWPGAGREIRRRTWLLVPLVEPGTVSYSHLARPGISYINVFRGSLLDLADDLLHETAHHRLHAWQEVEDFIRDPAETRYFSPWRRSMRPLNGILHGTFTFLFRAELFLRMKRRARAGMVGGVEVTPAKRRWLAVEAKRELRNCSASLRDLREAADAGLLTPAGRRLVVRMRSRLRLLKGAALSAKPPSSIL